MSSQPSEWAKIIAADGFAQVSTTGKKVKTKDCKPNGKHPVIDQGQKKIGGYVDDPEKLISITEPLIVFGDHTRTVKWVDFSFVPGADGTKILQAEPYLLPRFAYHQLRSLEIPNKGYSRHFKYLKELGFGVPPLAEQKVIADKLDTLLDQVENTKARLERIPQILKRFRQSVLAAAVSGLLTEEWREGRATNRTLEEFLKQLETLRQIAVQEENQRTGKKSKFKAVNIDTSDAPSELPESWNWIPVEALATKVTDGVHKKPTYVSSGVPFITVKNLTKGNGISFSETNFISENDHEEFCKRTNPEKGDILISKDGTLGVVRQIRTDKIFSIFVSVALVKPADRRMSDYLEIAFQSPVVQGQMIGVGTGLQHIHLTDLRKDLIPVPSLEEQTEIVRQVDLLFAHADRIEQQVNNALARVNNLTQSILAKAFRGELTEQWRKDNPELISGENSAEALLERIKAERAAQKPAGRRTKVRKTEESAS
ncbi:restriction endonuclease subunit S [Marinobacter sp. HN1S83]|uniref:restriction endonuclease subunit S n=1 Tax=Marinobacter sp. HN1S83 TaxID=3382301 RepID=UPI00387ADFCF